MHFHRIRTVKISNVFYWNSLTKICLKTVYSTIKQHFQFTLIPCTCIRICKIYQCHSRLPQIRLPYTSVCTFYQISVFFSFCKQNRILCNIWIDPYTDFQTLVMISLQHSLRICCHIWIPLEITPLESFHPVTVKMEHMKRNISVCHSLNETGSGIFVIIRCKRSGQPKTKGPCWRKCRFSSQICIFFHCFHRGSTTDKVIVQAFAFYRKLHSFYFLTGNLVSYISFVIYQNSVSLIGNIKWYILVCDLAGGSSILIPHFHNLTIFHKRCKTLAKTIYILIHINQKLLCHIIFSCVTIMHMSQIPVTGFCQEFIPIIKCQLISIRCFINHCFQISAFKYQCIFLFCDFHLGIFIFDFCKRSFIKGSCMMHCRNFNDSFLRTGKCDGQHRNIQRISTTRNVLAGKIYRKGISVNGMSAVFHCIGSIYFFS